MVKRCTGEDESRLQDFLQNDAVYPTFLLADYLVRAYEGSLSEQTDTVFPENGAFILQKIRERLSEELGMNIKTLDRTIQSMQKNGYFNLTKGKISFGYEEYIKMKEFITTEKG